MYPSTLAFALPFLVYGISVSAQGGLTVPTAQGLVVGTHVLPKVRQWLGVPFATAARWSPPTPPPARLSPLNANAYGNSCYQLTTLTTDKYLEYAHQDEPLTESEDCLTVNIWAPSIFRPQNAAVLIWIYGGGFQFGASALKVYDGRHLVRDSDNLIVVTFNYRLNIFGQPNAPQLVNPTNSQNFGLLDQKAAIEWVKDNIAAFGGNPNRISLFGQSAGAASADIYAQAYPTDTIVKGIILQSGSISGLNDLGSPTLDAAPWHTVAAAVGCGSTNTPAQFTCMQSTAAASLIQAAKAANIIFFKLVTDNIIIHSDWVTRMATGNFLKVPTIVGTVQHEADPLTVGGEIATRGNAPPFITTLLADILSQVGGTCGASGAAKGRVNNGVTTWRYQYQAVFPGISTRQDLRAFHGSEIPIVFGTVASIHDPTPVERALSSYARNAWSAFAKNPSSGLTSVGWPIYDPTANTLVQLGNVDNLDGASFASPYLLDATYQKAAIEWVKNNIAAFGGDPNRISLFGHSAGGTSADIYTQAYPTDTTVKGIILQSGSINALNNLGSPTLDDAPWHTVAAAVGCGSTATPAQFTCLQSKPAASLIQAAKAANINFFKLVTDNIIIYSDWVTRMATGNFMKVPTVVGTLQHESDPFAVGGEIVTRGNAPPFITTLMADILSHVISTCGGSAAAKERVDNGVTTWRYHYQAIFPGISTRQDLRAFHGSEIPIIFGTFASIHDPTPGERALSSYAKNAWSAFAKNPSSGLTSVGWPVYDPTADTFGPIRQRGQSGRRFFCVSLSLDATCPNASTLRGIYDQLTPILNAI